MFYNFAFTAPSASKRVTAALLKAGASRSLTLAAVFLISSNTWKFPYFLRPTENNFVPLFPHFGNKSLARYYGSGESNFDV